jgi:transposase-like protein
MAHYHRRPAALSRVAGLRPVRAWVDMRVHGVVDGKTTSEQNELVQLRRETRRLEMENEILAARPPTSPPAHS